MVTRQHDESDGPGAAIDGIARFPERAGRKASVPMLETHTLNINRLPVPPRGRAAGVAS